MLYMASESSRNQLGDLLNVKGLLGGAVEVGTHRGDYARILLDKWNGEKLYCIDPWQNLPEYKDQAKRLWGNGDRQTDYEVASKKLRPHSSRVELIKGISSVAVNQFQDQALDFVYLDGNHEPPFVEEDIKVWWPKVKSGGILAGHDILCPGEPDGLWGKYIQPAVFKFAESQKLDVYLIVEENNLPWSYYILKP